MLADGFVVVTAADGGSAWGHFVDWSQLFPSFLLGLQLAFGFSQFAHNKLLLHRPIPLPPPVCVFCVSVQTDNMSGQQCLRRLAASSTSSPLRSLPLLRASSRTAARLPATSNAIRSYTAVTRATSSGLLSQASRYATIIGTYESIANMLKGDQHN
jgi:hypothetical protein